MINKRGVGEYYEDAACFYLSQNGIEILDRNVHMSNIGEIDIIGVDRSSSYGETLVFFEVKYRRDGRYGTAAEAVNARKIAKIRKCASYYLAYKKEKRMIRFDVLAIDGDKINWIKNAF